LRVTPEARAAVQLAGEEATALGAARIGSEHVLLGILRASDDVGAAALRACGVTLDGARAAAQPTLADDAPGGAKPGSITAYARRVFAEALRQAAADPGHVIAVRDLLRAALRDPRGGACRTLDALGVSADDVRTQLSG
ncbi:MAG TPA: Clp protease N-terminal domain-containing protein, partial [Solirubrobacter sp.]|nr:Clp protease N-terminal domain-containing protein [Solirubrobacter sp.]